MTFVSTIRLIHNPPLLTIRVQPYLDNLGSGCGTVEIAVASNTRGPGFGSSHRQLLLNIFTVNCLSVLRH